MGKGPVAVHSLSCTSNQTSQCGQFQKPLSSPLPHAPPPSPRPIFLPILVINFEACFWQKVCKM